MSGVRGRLWWLTVVGVAAAVATPLAVNPRLHLRGDGLSNEAIAHAILRHGIPPPDPYLAGQPLYYHWGYNAAAVGIAAMLGIEPLAVMVWSGPVSLAVLLAGTVWLSRCLCGGRLAGRHAALTVLLAAFGLNGWGYLILLGRLAFGLTTLADAFGQGVHPFLRSVVAGYSDLLGFLATKALVATSFAWNMAFVVLALAALAAYVQERRRRQAAGFAAAAALAAYANLFVGALLLALVGAVMAVWACGQLRIADRGLESKLRNRCLTMLAMVGVAAIAVAPYLWVTTVGAMGRESLVRLALPDEAHVLGLGVGLLPLWVALAIVGRPRLGSTSQAVVALVAVAFALVFLLARVVDEVEVKLGFVVAVLVAAWVGSRAGQLPARRVRWVWVLAASCVPTTLLGLVAYARAPEPARATEDERAVLEFIAREAPRDAVVVWADQRATLVPPIARRDLYVPGILGFHRAARCDRAEWERRSAKMQRLMATGDAVEVLDTIRGELGERPIILVVRGDTPRADHPRLRRLARAGGLSAWALKAAEGRE